MTLAISLASDEEFPYPHFLPDVTALFSGGTARACVPLGNTYLRLGQVTSVKAAASCASLGRLYAEFYCKTWVRWAKRFKIEHKWDVGGPVQPSVTG